MKESLSEERIKEIRERVSKIPDSPMFWRKNYELGVREFHWALESEESAKEGRVVGLETVLLDSWTPPDQFNAKPFPQLFANAAADVRDLLDEVERLRRERPCNVELADTIVMALYPTHLKSGTGRDDEIIAEAYGIVADKLAGAHRLRRSE